MNWAHSSLLSKDFGVQVLVENKMQSIWVFHLSVQIFNTNLSLRDPTELKIAAVD